MASDGGEFGSWRLDVVRLRGYALKRRGRGGHRGLEILEGTMEKDYPRDMQAAYQACLSAANTMGLRVAQQQYGQTESRLEAVQPPDATVKIQLVARPQQITTVKVRFGMMGNEDQSAYFHRQVMKNSGRRTGLGSVSNQAQQA